MPVNTVMVTYLTINNGLWEIEFTDHTKGDCTTTWLGVIKLALEKNGINILLLSKDLGGAGSRGPSSNNCNLVLHAESRGTGGAVGNTGAANEGGRSEGGHRGQSGESNSQLHL